MPPPVVGLVGGIGSGKSRVAEALARRGAVVVAGDPAGHEALRQPEIKAAVRDRWGDGVFGADGEVNRRALGKVVFADPAELRALESVVFPWIGRRLREQLAEARVRPGVAMVVLDAAVMLEAGWNNACDRVVYVDAPREIRLARVRQRGWTEADLNAREAAQMPLDEKAARADLTIDNGGSPEQLERQLDRLMAFLGRSSGRGPG
jgi:dephospho-CoA kinase